MVVTVVNPGIVVAVHQGVAADGGVAVVLELTATGSVQFACRQVAVVDNDREAVLHGNLSGHIDNVAVDEHAVAIGRQFARLNATVIVNVQTVVEHQLVVGHNLGTAGNVELTVRLQVGGVRTVQHQGSTAHQEHLRIACHIEATVGEVVIARYVERSTGAVRAPDVHSARPRRVEITRTRSVARLGAHQRTVFLYATGHSRQKLAVVSIVREVVSVGESHRNGTSDIRHLCVKPRKVLEAPILLRIDLTIGIHEYFLVCLLLTLDNRRVIGFIM